MSLQSRFSLMTVVFILALGPALAEEVTLTGRVVGPEGEAIAGARVAQTRVLDREPHWVETTSDAEGQFRLQFETDYERDAWQAVAVAEGHAPGAASAKPGEPVELVLPEEHRALTGTVVDPGGQPISQAHVAVRALNSQTARIRYVGFGEWPAAPSDTTGEDGRFSLGPLPVGYLVQLRAEAPGYAYSRPTAREDMPSAGDDITLTLHPEAVIAGRVTREGEPVAGVEVGVQSQQESHWGEATTDEDGRYEITALPAATYNVALITPPDGYAAVAHEGVQPEAGERAEQIDFELIEGGLVRGTVTWADSGEPVPGASIGAYGPAHPRSTAWVQSAEADEQGAYELRLPPGENYVYWMGGPTDVAWRAEQRDVTLHVEEGTVQTVDFRLQRKPTIQLTVLNPDGTLAAGVPVYWDADLRHRYMGEREPLVTDEQGRVELSFGRQTHERGRALEAALAHDPERDLAGIAVIDGESTRQATIRLAEAAWLLAAIRETDGSPVPNASVSVYTEQEGGNVHLPLQFATEEDGQVRLGPLPPKVPVKLLLSGDLAMKVASGPAEEQEMITLVPAETRELEPFVVAMEGLVARGRVIDPEGEPVEGAVVIGKPGADWNPVRARTDADGHFELTGLGARETVTILAATEDGSLAYAQPVDPSVALELVFELFPPPSLIVTVAGEADAVARARAGVERSGPRFGELPQGLTERVEEIELDEEGRFRVDGLIPGLQYSVMAYVGEPRPEAIELVAGEQVMVHGGEETIELSLELMTMAEFAAQQRR
ncbi:MAG: carboxypeptidase-like regulatory domain-containing protein [Armatimonadota bacterium]|nr:carboxypeptidase-like regulatory domain-containing protein [Armatimonadota bacterium]